MLHVQDVGWREEERWLAERAEALVEMRRWLHRYPELSGCETGTTAWLSGKLAASGIAHRVGEDGIGVITETRPGGGKGAPVVALRADMDALPIVEENAAGYASVHEGVMHACGHDAHTAMLMAAVQALGRCGGGGGAAWRGIFQPSEEAGHGARSMIRQGALEEVGAVVALHVDPNLPCGEMAVVTGPQTAFCQDFVIEITGRGGHGARPHLTVDALAVAAQLVTLIYQALPRRVDARDALVVTVGQLQAGHASNVIPEQAVLKGTIRAFDGSVIAQARDTLEKLCAGTALAFGAAVKTVFEEWLPGVVNDPAVTAQCLMAARSVVGPANVITEGRPSMGAEDFADYQVQLPGCMVRLGVAKKGQKVTPLHTPTFDIDENALLIGARFFVRVIRQWGADPDAL